jgi:hypothetical protein
VVAVGGGRGVTAQDLGQNGGAVDNGVPRGEVVGVEARDRREDLLEAHRSRAAHPLLTEGGVAQGVAEGSEAQFEGLRAVRSEQEPGTAELVAQAGVAVATLGR